MSVSNFTLKGNHRDTFRLVPVGQSVVDPATYIHVPTNPDGFAEFSASPSNYYVYARPAYTSEFVLLESGVLEDLQYLRVLNPEITSDGIVELASLLTNLTVEFSSELNNLPWIKDDELLSIRVIATTGGVPSASLQNVPTLNLYRKPGGTGDPELVTPGPVFVDGTCSINTYITQQACEAAGETWTQIYDSANPHIYTYHYTPGTGTEDLYYFRAYAGAENVWSPEFPDVDTYTLDYTPPTLDDPQNQVFLSSAASDLTDAAITTTASVFVSIPETAISDTSSGPEFYHLQPFLKNKTGDSPTGLQYTSASGTHDFEDTNLAGWDLASGNGFNLLITDGNGDEILFRNYGDLTNDNANNEFTISIDATSTKFSLSSLNGGTFSLSSTYSYRLFKHGYSDICVGDPGITDPTACPQGGVCSNGTDLNQTDCENNSAEWTANYWKTGEEFVHDWPIEFSTTGNLIQAVLLTQDLPNGFLDNITNGIEYGFLISGSDKAQNTNVQPDEWLAPTITFDSVVEIAPNLNWWWINNYAKTPQENVYVNENNWFNTGELSEETGGICSNASYTNKTDCIDPLQGNATWTPDTLTLIVQCVDGQTQAENANFGIQWSYDNQNWRTVVSTDNLNIGTSKYYINEFDPNLALRQGTHTLYIRGVNNDGSTATGSSQTINYQWDRLRPEWASPGTTEEIGGFNRAYFNWTTSPVDAGDAGTTDEPGQGGVLDSTEGFSGVHEIEIWRSIKQSTTPHLWNTVTASPSNYELTYIDTIAVNQKEFTDTNFINIAYDAQVLPPFYYWGVPVDIAGNGKWDKDNATGATAALLCTLDTSPNDGVADGIEVTPLQPADVAGTLGTTIYVPNSLPNVIEVHRDIAVPTDGLILRTNEITTLYSLHKLAYSADGFSYTSIPAVDYKGEFYTIGYLDLSNTSSVTFTSNILISSTDAAALGLDHLLNVMSTHDRAFTGLTYITSSRCKIGGSYSALPTTFPKAFCSTNGGTWEEERKVVQFEQVFESGGNVTLEFVSLDGGDVTNWTTRYGDATWLIEFGFRLDTGMHYAFSFPVIDNQYFYRLAFNADVPTEAYCDSKNPAHSTKVLCEAASANWIALPDIGVDNESVNFATKLAADLIVGGTLRLETGLSIWSGGYVDGEPQGTGVAMDEQGIKLFKNSNTTVELNATDGSFSMGDLSDPAGNKISFDPASGQLSLIGNLYQINPNSGYGGSTVFVGDWLLGSCSGADTTSTNQTDCEDAGTNGGAGLWTIQSYTAGEIVLYNSEYWLCISNVSNGAIPSAANDTYWALYASSGIEGQSAQGLSINLESNTFVADEHGTPISPAHIKVYPNAQNIGSGNLNWDTTAIDLNNNPIAQNADGLAVPLYTDESGTNIPALSPIDQDVYIYLSDLTNVKSLTVSASYTVTTLEGETIHDYSDSSTLHRTTEGSSAYNIILSNQTHLVPMDQFGDVSSDDWASCLTNVQLFLGSEQVNCSVVLSDESTNWSSAITTGQNTEPTVKLHDDDNNSAESVGTVRITVTDVDNNVAAGEAIFTVTKVASGISSRTLSLSPSSATYTVDPNGGNTVVSPINTDASNALAIDFTVINSNLNIDTVAWSVNTSSGTGGISIPPYTAETGNPDDTLYANTFQVVSGSSGQASEPHTVRLFLDGGLFNYGADNDSLTVTVSATDQSGGTCSNSAYTTEATCIAGSGSWTSGETFTDSVTVNRLILGSDSYVASLSNDNYTVSAAYDGNINLTPDAGGAMSLYRGVDLLTDPDVSFGTKGAWFGRVWHNWDPGFDDLTIANIIARGKPDQTASHHWSDFNSNSQIQGANFFDTDPVDHFVGWVTTWIKASDTTALTSEVFSGDNAHKFYINNVPIVEEALWSVDTTYSYTFNPTSGWASPNDTASTGPWYRLDIIWWESTGGDHVAMGWNPDTISGLEGYGGVVADINATTGFYSILKIEEFVEQATATFKAVSTSDNVEVLKDYSLSVAQSGAPGTYLKSVYFTGTYGTFAELETFMQGPGAGSYDWPLDNLEAETLTGWQDTLPVAIADLPGNTTWTTERVLRVDGTTIEGENWSSPTILTHSPPDPVIYYIKPTNGTSLHNGTTPSGDASLNIAAYQQDQTNGDSSIPNDGNKVLSINANGIPSLGNTASFTSGDINGSLIVYLVDTTIGPTVLDTITLVDVSDGVPVGTITGDPGLVFTQQIDGSWTPASITVSVKFYDNLGNVSDSLTGILQCDSSGNITTTQDFNASGTDVTVNDPFPGEGTSQIGLSFTHNTTGITIQETLYAVAQGQQGESITGETGPSLTYTGGWDMNRLQYFAGDHAGGDSPLGEIVKYDHTVPTGTKDHHEKHGAAYICKQTHNPNPGGGFDALIYPADTLGNVDPFWQAFGATFESVATGLLLADTVIAKDIFGDKLELTDSFKIKSPDGYCTLSAMKLDDYDGTGTMADWLGNGVNDHTEHNGNYMIGKVVGGDNPQEFPYFKWDSSQDNNTSAPGYPAANIHDSHFGPDTTCIAVHSFDYEGTDFSPYLEQLQVGDVISLYLHGQSFSEQGASYYFKIVENADKKQNNKPTGVYRASEFGVDTQGDTPNPHVFQLDVEYLPTTTDLGTGAELTSSLSEQTINAGADYGNWGINLMITAPGGTLSDESSCIAASGTWNAVANELSLGREGINIKDRTGEQTVNIDANSGDFIFGKESTDQYLKFQNSELKIGGTLIVEGTEINQGLRGVDLSTENPFFTWTNKALANYNKIDSLALATSAGSKYGMWSSIYSFEAPNAGRVLVRALLHSAGGEIGIVLNGTYLSNPREIESTPDGTNATNPHWEQYDNAVNVLDNEGVCRNSDGVLQSSFLNQIDCLNDDATNIWDRTYRWYEFYTSSAVQVGTNQIKFQSAVVSGATQVPGAPINYLGWETDSVSNTDSDDGNQWFMSTPAGSTSSVDTNPPAGGIAGMSALKHFSPESCTGNAQLWSKGTYFNGQLNDTYMPCNPNKRYMVSVNVYQDSGNKHQYLAVRFRNSSGSNISPTMPGKPWTSNGSYYYPLLANAEYPQNQWTRYTFIMGPDYYDDYVDFGIPEDAVEMRIGALVNRTTSAGDSPGDTTVWFQDYRITELNSWIGGIEVYTDPAPLAIDVATAETNLNATSDPTWNWAATETDPGYLGDADLNIPISLPSSTPNERITRIDIDDFHEKKPDKPLLPTNVNLNVNVSHADWSTNVYDNITISRSLVAGNGADAINGYLTNESQTIPFETTGSWTGMATGQFKVMEGITEITSSCSFTAESGINVTGDITADGGYYISDLHSGADAGQLYLTALCAGVELNKTFTLSLARAGQQGIDGSPGAAQFFYNDLETGGDATEQGMYLLEAGAEVFPNFAGENGLNTNFSTANKIILNTIDQNGSNNEEFYLLLKAGDTIIFHINANRWYQYVLLADPAPESTINIPAAMDNWTAGDPNRVGFSVAIVNYVEDVTTALDAAADSAPAYWMMGSIIPGSRGSRQFSVDSCSVNSGTSWQDLLASTTASEDGGPVVRDLVTEFCEAQGFSETRYWTGSAWSVVTSVIDGNLLVDGTIAADALAADVVNASFLNAGSITTDKIAIGASSNLLGLEIKDAENWAELQSLGWYSNFTSTGLSDITKRDPNTYESSTHKCIYANNVGSNNDIIYSPWVPIEPGQAYNLSTTIAFWQGNTTEYGSFYWGVEYSTNGSSNNVSNTRIYKSTSGSAEFQDRNWGDETDSNNYLWQIGDLNTNVTIGTYGQEAGLSNSYKYRDYWFPMNRVAHAAGSSFESARSGGNIQKSFLWTRAMDSEASNGGAVANIVAPAAATHMRLRWLCYKGTGYGTAGSQWLVIKNASITQGVGTEIDGSSIATGSITADQIVANYLDAVSITADNLRTGTIASSNLSTWWDLDEHVFIVKSGGVVRIKIGDLDAPEDAPSS